MTIETKAIQAQVIGSLHTLLEIDESLIGGADYYFKRELMPTVG
jgi:hypothetical protein